MKKIILALIAGIFLGYMLCLAQIAAQKKHKIEHERKEATKTEITKSTSAEIKKQSALTDCPMNELTSNH